MLVRLFLGLFLVLVHLRVSIGGPVNRYSDSVARELVKYAGVTYCQQQEVTSWNFTSSCQSLMTSSFKILRTFYDQKTDAFGYIGVNTNDGWLLVAIKGTNPEDIRDWIDDLDTGLFYNSPCKLPSFAGSQGVQFFGHTGFCNYYLSIRQDLIATVRSALQTYGKLDVIVTGHSLGGAASSLHAIDLLYNIPSSMYSTVKLYTFGEPRGGDVSLGKLFQAMNNVEVYRITHRVDPVPHIPLCCEVSGGACTDKSSCPFHEPMEVYYDNDMNAGAAYKACSLVDWEDMSCSNENILDWNVEDHLHYFGVEIAENCCYSN